MYSGGNRVLVELHRRTFSFSVRTGGGVAVLLATGRSRSDKME